jgi:hypothetical protein
MAINQTENKGRLAPRRVFSKMRQLNLDLVFSPTDQSAHIELM